MLTNGEAAAQWSQEAARLLVVAGQSQRAGDLRLASLYARRAAQACDVASTYREKDAGAQADDPTQGAPLVLGVDYP